MAEDFDDRVDVLPVSNPNVFSQSQRIVMAQTKLQLASQAPELHNMHEVFRDMYTALGVSDVDRIMKRMPDEEPRPTDPAQENINVLDNLPLRVFEGQDHQAHIMAHLIFANTPMVAQLPAVGIALQKHIMEHVKVAAQEQAAVALIQQVQQSGGQPATEEQMLQLEKMTAQLISQGMQQLQQISAQLTGAGQPDPLIELKKQELAIKQQAEQNDAAMDQQKAALDAQSLAMRSKQFDERLAAQERQTQARIDSAMERELLKQRGQ
jgi:hypothetical protein